MNKEILKDVLTRLYWYKDQVDDPNLYLSTLLHLAVEVGDIETEKSIRDYLLNLK